MNQNGFVVPPRKKVDIYSAATSVRNCFKSIISSAGRLPIDVVYELLPDLMPGFELQVVEKCEIGEDHGQTFPDRKLIKLRRDVYDGMCQGRGRDRFTGAHELGHLFLHQNVAFARALDVSTTKIYYGSEWQANTFASALLIDECLLAQCGSVLDVVERFGVSLEAAQVRFKK